MPRPYSSLCHFLHNRHFTLNDYYDGWYQIRLLLGDPADVARVDLLTDHVDKLTPEEREVNFFNFLNEIEKEKNNFFMTNSQQRRDSLIVKLWKYKYHITEGTIKCPLTPLLPLLFKLRNWPESRGHESWKSEIDWIFLPTTGIRGRGCESGSRFENWKLDPRTAFQVQTFDAFIFCSLSGTKI